MRKTQIAAALTPIIAAGLFVFSMTTGTQPPVTNDAATYVGQLPAPRKINVREYVRNRASRNGWTWRQWQCAARLITKENREWSPTAANPHSSAYGLFQILRTPKGTPLHKQTTKFFEYIAQRYDNDPCKAWAHHQQKNWY